jgi:hypothetical protein
VEEMYAVEEQCCCRKETLCVEILLQLYHDLLLCSMPVNLSALFQGILAFCLSAKM